MKNGDKEYIVKLFHPLTLQTGEVKEELSVDLDVLTWADLHNLELEYAALFQNASPTNGIYFTDSKYQALMVARINGIVFDQVVRLKASDAFNLSNRLGRFLSRLPLEQVKVEDSSTVVQSES